MRIGDLTVPMWGDGHNLYPQEVFSITSENKILPEVINKQVKFLFGKGPRLYKEVLQGEEDSDKQRRVRLPVQNEQVQKWLDSWESQGFDSVYEYLKKSHHRLLLCEYLCFSIYFQSQSQISRLLKFGANTYQSIILCRL